MWTYLEKANEDAYLNQYPSLVEGWDSYKLYETGKFIFVPRLFCRNFPSHYLKQHKGKVDRQPAKINVKFTKSLRPKQEKAVAEILKIYEKTGSLAGIGKMPPGWGKTVVGVYLAVTLGFKTCIIVDQEPLMKQWIKAILDFTNLTISDIGIIQGKIFNTDKPIVIAMAQSLLSKLKRDMNKAFEQIDSAGFGFVQFDEVHATSASDKFSKVSILFRTDNNLGLSASPFHYGTQEVLMKNTIGEIIFETNEYELTPKYYLVYYKSGLEKYAPKLNAIHDHIAKRAVYNKILIQSPKYIEMITRYNNNMRKKDYCIMNIFMTINQVDAIAESMNNIHLENRVYHGKEREIDKINDELLLTTYKMSGKGFDMPSLSALLLCTPLAGTKSLIQTIGRILRSDVNKKDPVVIDFVDLSFPMFMTPLVTMKKNIIMREFPNCSIVEYTEK